MYSLGTFNTIGYQKKRKKKSPISPSRILNERSLDTPYAVTLNFALTIDLTTDQFFTSLPHSPQIIVQ